MNRASLISALAVLIGMAAVQPSQAASQTVSDGTYRIVSKFSGKSVDVKSTSSSNSAAIVQDAYSSSATSQQWLVKHMGSGYYRLINAYSNKAMDVSASSTADGGAIIQYTYNGGNNQLWEIRAVGTTGYYALINKNSGKALDVYGWSTTDEGILDQWTYWTGDCQLWEMKYVSSNTVFGSTSTTSSSSSTTSTTTTTTTTSSSSSVGTPVGYASLNGGTTGGTGGTTTTVTTCSAFLSAVTGTSKKIVQLTNGNIDCRTSSSSVSACPISCSDGTTWYRVPVTGQTCTDLGATGSAVTKTRNERSVTVGSYTTIIGLGSSSALLGVSLDLSSQKQIILKNFHLTEINPGLVEAGDGVSVQSATNVWIDHMRFSRISDGYFDIKYSSYVTVSYTHVNGYNTDTCRDQHWYVSLVQDSTVTFHHNFWDRPAGRNPKVLGSSARVHLFNNYWKSVYYFCISSSDSAIVLVENNYFEDSRYPHWVDGGSITISSNTYTGASTTSGTGRSSGGSSLSVSYSYTKDTAASCTSLSSSVGPK